MKCEFYNLCNTVRAYTASIIQNLEKVDKNILETIQEFEVTFGPTASKKKYKLSQEMVQILENYIKFLFLTESLVNKIPSKTCDNETIDNIFTNPFKSSEIESSDFPIIQVDIKQELNTNAENSETLANITNISIENQCENVSKNEKSEEKKETEVKSVEEEEKLPPPVDNFSSTSSVKFPINYRPIKHFSTYKKNSLRLPQRSRDDKSTDKTDIKLNNFQNKTEDERKNEVKSEVDISSRGKSKKQNQRKSELPIQLLELETLPLPLTAPLTVSKVENTPTPLKLMIREPQKNLNNSLVKTSTSEENTPSELANKEEPKYTAVTKLLSMTFYDRKKEAEKRYEGERQVEDFKWKVCKKLPNVMEKKRNEKHAIYEIKDDDLKVNEQCYFSCIVNPNEFYVRTNEELFESLESSLNEDLNNTYQYVVANYQSKDEAKAILGNFCFVFLCDNRKWFRVQIVDWMVDDLESVLVQLIDYGDIYLVRYKNLKAMMALYAEFPKMAIRCHLAGIYPVSSDKGQWSFDSISTLKELSEMEIKTKFLVMYVQKQGDSYAVDLIKDGCDSSLAQILAEKRLAVEDKILNIIPEEDEEDDLEEYDGINEAIAGYDAKDEERICPFTDNSGRCFKGPKCKLDHGKLSKDGITTDKVLSVTQALEKLQLPEPGEKITILITGYINTCHFYAQIIRNRSKSDLFNDEFQLLKDNMNASNIVQTYEPFKVYPGIGEVLLVKYRSEWHRARCVELEGLNRLNVFLVDFGVKFTTKMNEVRQIKDDFLYVPFQAVECILDSCCEIKNVIPNVSEGFFQNCMQFQNFSALVVDGGEPLMLKLWDANNMDMDYVLKQYGLGQDRCHNSLPKENILTIG